ncbi:ROK family protein [Candidatus Woesearchaeota archaeon]|nr:ROK family protein [Candidatus Woesearchaeota archaeon]
MTNLIGVDLGGTNIKTALVSKTGKILKNYETATGKTTNEIINNIISAINKVKEGKIWGIGIGSPGPIDHKKGTITKPVNLPFRNVKLKNIIQNKFKVKTFLDNDANCFALAEATFGQGKKYENVIGITLGTGVGGGLVINKKIFHGRNNAAELGHITINHKGSKSKCKNHGCIETHIAARGITKLFDKKAEPKQVCELAKQGNKKAKKTFEEMGSYLGIGIVNIMYAFDPDIIVLGGKISNAQKIFSKSMNREIKTRYFSKPCPIKKSKLKEPGVLGAAALNFN